MNKVTSFVKPSNINRKSIRLDLLKKYTNKFVSGDIYQFGVYSGVSIDNILEVLNELKTPLVVWGFDSFEGLPKENKEQLRFQEWEQGEFSSCDYLDVKDPKEAALKLEIELANKYPQHSINMIVGYFSDVLPNFGTDFMFPASYIDIDVDLYSSTIELWDFMLQNKLVREGTMVYYDDWKGYNYGEGRAHMEICDKYGIKFTHLEGEGERLFIVDEI